MIDGLLIYLNDENITSKVLAESFPDYIEESWKGTGLFDFEASDLTFKVFGLSVKRDDTILIKRAGTGEKVFAGFVDEIDEDTSVIQELTICSSSVKLKDTKIGEEVDTGEDETVREFDTKTQMSVKEIVQRVLQAVYDRIGLMFIADDSTIQVAPGTVRKFFGNVLRKLPRQGLLSYLIDLVFSEDRGYHFRYRLGCNYVIEEDAMFKMKTFWEKGSFLDWSFSIPPTTIDLGVTKIKKGSWVHFHFKIPPFDLKFPTIGAKYWVYLCRDGGIEYVRTHEYFPLFPFEDHVPPLEALYGKRVNKSTSENISTQKIRSFLSEEGYDPDSLMDVTVVDYNDTNTYVSARALKKYNDLLGRDLLLSFETPFDQYYNMTYRDASAMDILHDLAVLTNSYVYVDQENKVYLLPRGEALRSITIPRRNVIEMNRETTKVEDVLVDINRYEEDSEGRVSSYGVRVRKNEWDAIQSYYKSVMEGIQTDTIAKMFEPGDIRLADRVIIDGTDLGIVTIRRRGLLEPVTEVTCEKILESE